MGLLTIHSLHNQGRCIQITQTPSRLGSSPSEDSCQKFVRFYLFSSHFELISSHEHLSSFLLTHVLTLTMISPHVLSPLFHFAFTIHTKSEPLRTQRSRFEDLWTGAIYSRGSSPGTFSHPIPYRKASPMVSLDAHSSTNS